MDGFLKRLLASPFLRRSRAERDERGRVLRVIATLGPERDAGRKDGSVGGPDTVLPEWPESEKSERLALLDAARWLDGAAQRDVRELTLGEECSCAFDLAAGTLRLRHADGTDLILPGEILCSFRPRDRSFRWAWANSNVAPPMVRSALLT